jgi:TorA maturation chaperone TorD
MPLHQEDTLKPDFKTITELDERTLGYSFLFRSFIEEPSKEFIREVKNKDILIFLSYIEENEIIKEGIELIEGYLNKEASVEKLTDEMSVEYSSLFIGAGKPLVSTWESIALGSGRLFSVNETLNVRKYYAKYGLLPERLNKEPDDHIGFELQFMYILADKTAKAMESRDYEKVAALISDQKEFLENHLSRWAGIFADEVCARSNNDFYTGTAKVLKGMVSADYSKICEMLERLEIKGGHTA